MAEQEDPELTSSQGHTNTTTIYRATTDEEDRKTRSSTTEDFKKEPEQNG